MIKIAEEKKKKSRTTEKGKQQARLVSRIEVQRREWLTGDKKIGQYQRGKDDRCRMMWNSSDFSIENYYMKVRRRKTPEKR